MPIQSHNPADHMDPEISYCCPVGVPMPETHYVSLGKFLFSCAQIETAAHIYLRRLLPIEDTLARTLIGQPRLDDLINTITKCFAHLEYTDAEFNALRELKGYLTYIYKVRNIIAHQEPAWRPGWLRYDRYATAKDISKRESLIYVIQLSELDNLSEFARLVRDALGPVTRAHDQNIELQEHVMPRLHAWLETHELPADPEKPFRNP